MEYYINQEKAEDFRNLLEKLDIYSFSESEEENQILFTVHTDEVRAGVIEEYISLFMPS